MNERMSESGNVFFIILLAIAMFAGLSYAVFQGSRSSMSSLTDDQARLAAQEIIAYGDAMATAVQTLRLRGCTENQIDFSGNNGVSKLANGTALAYSNTSAPSDGSCNVFTMNGGKLTPKLVESGYITPSSVPANWMDSQSFVASAVRIPGVGSSTVNNSELVVWRGRLTEQVCRKINFLLNISPETEPFVLDTFDGSSVTTDLFDGTYPPRSDTLGNTATRFAGKTAFCSRHIANEMGFMFFRVLIAR